MLQLKSSALEKLKTAQMLLTWCWQSLIMPACLWLQSADHFQGAHKWMCHINLQFIFKIPAENQKGKNYLHKEIKKKKKRMWSYWPPSFFQPKLFCCDSHIRWLWCLDIWGTYTEGRDGTRTKWINSQVPELHPRIPSSTAPTFFQLCLLQEYECFCRQRNYHSTSTITASSILRHSNMV